MATPALSDAKINEHLATLTGWTREGDSITKTYAFKSYLEGIAFAAAVGTIAEGKDHHPDLLIKWRKVTVNFTTHDAGSKISLKDIETATAIEALGFPKA